MVCMLGRASRPNLTVVSLDEIAYATSDGIATVTLNRPEMRNAISGRSGGTRDQIIEALVIAESDDNLRCIILNGAGKSFCCGGDLTGNSRRETYEDDLAFLETADAFHARVRSSTKPIIAAVHGHCLGAGLLLAMSCDFVLAAESTLFGFPEARLGLVGATTLVDVVGRQWAKFLMTTGELISAAQAHELGLVFSVEPDGELGARAFDLARRLTRMPSQSVLANRRAIDAAADAGGATSLRGAAMKADAHTLGLAALATAPDGRTFRSIIDSDGIAGMKAAQAQQYSENWLRSTTSW